MNSTRYARIISGIAVAAIALAIVGLAPAPAQAQYTGVLTWHNDNQRTGQNVSETILTPSNVDPKHFGKLFSFPVDAQVYAQPLYVSSVAIPGQGTHNVVYVATENDSVYAFDADGLTNTPLWQDSFLSTGVTAEPCTASPGTCAAISPLLGITGTPVIDPATGTLFVVAATAESGTYVQRLHALDITNGAEKFGGPVVIQATVPGTGGGSVHKVLTFSAIHELQRESLLLLNGVVYIGWAGYGNPPWHGWILGYSASQGLAQVAVWNDTANALRGGIWNSGAAFPVDSAGNIYVVTGDGTFDANTGGSDYGDSFVKLSPTGTNGLTPEDYFTPFNQAYLAANDLDTGSGGAVIVPTNSVTPPTEAIIGGDKEGMLFVVYCDSPDGMGGYSTSTNNNIQTISSTGNGFWNTPAYWNGALYTVGTKSTLNRYTVTGGLLSTTPVSQSVATFTYPGATVSISSNGTKNGIVWVIDDPSGKVSGGPAAILRAYAALNVAKQLYGSGQSGTRDVAGPAVKFQVPTIYNGKVYVGTQTELDVYGLLTAK